MKFQYLFFFLLFIVFYTYIGYGLLLWFMVKIKRLLTQPVNLSILANLPHVTLFITAYNEQENVNLKMNNSLQLDYPSDKLHIVWVTDGSTDQTNDLLKDYDVKVLFDEARKGKTAAMVRGMKYVDTPLTIFTDANTMINKEAIKEIVTKFSDEGTGCVAGEKRIVIQEQDTASSSGESFYWKYESALKALDSELCSTIGAAGELFGIRTHLFEPMPEDTLLDDFMLSLRIAQRGYKIAYCPTAYAIETGSLDMDEEEKRKIRIAAGGVQSILRLKSLFNIFRYRTLSFQYVSHRVLRWTITPIALFLLFPINFLLCVLSDSLFFTLLFVMQCLFYILGILGYYLSKREIKNKLIFIPYYFLFMNLNVIKGFFYLKQSQGKGTWSKAKRK